MLFVVTAYNLEIVQFDIATVFLNSELVEDVIMEQTNGYKVGNNLVCKLVKGLYGLKQAPRAWHQPLKEKLSQMDLVPTNSESCLYVKQKG